MGQMLASSCLDAVGYAVNQLLQMANTVAVVPQQFRVGIYPFIQTMDANYAPLTSSINGSPNTAGTINYAAANLATELDTNANAALGSGGTNIAQSLGNMNTTIVSVGNGSSASSTLPYVFLVTDGAVDPQTKQLSVSGGWAGSNHATVIASGASSPCKQLRDRGIKVSVLYIPYVPINPVNASFANDEDDYANNNIANIPASLQSCASPPDSSGSYFYTASSPQQIQDSLKAMFNHALVTAHITN